MVKQKFNRSAMRFCGRVKNKCVQLCVGLWEALHSFILCDSQTAVQMEKKEKEKLNITPKSAPVRSIALIDRYAIVPQAFRMSQVAFL